MVKQFSYIRSTKFWCFLFRLVGASISAPILGRIVDSQGPRILFVLSFALLLGGYSGIKYLYDTGLPSGTSTLPSLSLYILVLCKFLTGCGGFGGLTSSLNSTVKSFPSEEVSNKHQSIIIVCFNVVNLSSQRASVTSLVVAGFGLSAFFFTTLSSTLLRSTTSTFLLVLAMGTSCLMLLGFLVVRPVSLPKQGSSQLEDSDEPALSPGLQHRDHSQTPLLNDDSIKVRYVRTDVTTDGEHSNSVGEVMEATRSVPVSGQEHSTALNVYGKALLNNLDFWLLFSISSMRMFLLQLYIYIYLILRGQFWALVLPVCFESF